MSLTWDGGSIFGGATGNDVFGSGGGSTGGTGGGGSSDPITTGNGWLDRLYSDGRDIFSDFLDLKKDQWLIDEKTKLARAQMQQQQMLGTVQQPSQVNAQALEPWQIAAIQQSQQSSSNQKLLIWALIAAVAYTALK